MTATLGYARVSTGGQDLDIQRDALHAAGVDPARVFTDTLSGAAGTHRPGLTALLDYAREGDTVIVSAIDRLGRSVAEVTRTIADLGERRILLRAIREGIDTATPTGRAVAAIMATLAELELELGRERRAAARDSRRAAGYRPPNRPNHPRAPRPAAPACRHRRTRHRTGQGIRHRPRHRISLPAGSERVSTRHIYIDETKERGYVLVASAHLGPDVDAVRKNCVAWFFADSSASTWRKKAAAAAKPSSTP
jgi:DNA invertase Pin-like site-specific DNA recombinase